MSLVRMGLCNLFDISDICYVNNIGSTPFVNQATSRGGQDP